MSGQETTTRKRIIVGGSDVTDAIRATVASAPPLTTDQRAHLRRLFGPVVRQLAAERANGAQGEHAEDAA